MRREAGIELHLSPSRIVVVVGSGVAVGAITKGRSSSFMINGLLRKLMSHLIMSQTTIALIWVPSAENPSDDPSRFVPLRQPRIVNADWLAAGLVPEVVKHSGARGPSQSRRLCLEVFAGYGGLSAALINLNLPVGRPWEAFPSKTTYVQQFDICNDIYFYQLLDDIRQGIYIYIHIATPCTTWGPAARRNGCSRRPESPEGDGKCMKETLGNMHATRTF